MLCDVHLFLIHKPKLFRIVLTVYLLIIDTLKAGLGREIKKLKCQNRTEDRLLQE